MNWNYIRKIGLVVLLAEWQTSAMCKAIQIATATMCKAIDCSDVQGNTDCSDVQGNTDCSDVQGNTDCSDVHGNTDLNDVQGNTDCSDVQGNTDCSDVQGNTDCSDVQGNTDCSDVQGNTDCNCNDVQGNTDWTPNTVWWHKVHAVWPVDWRTWWNRAYVFWRYSGLLVDALWRQSDVPKRPYEPTAQHHNTWGQTWTLIAMKTWKIINGLRRSDFFTFITCLDAK